MKVLVADDHSVFRTGLVQVLRVLRRDVDVVEATDFDEAVTIVSGPGEFDLVLVDLLMPGMEPFEGLKALTELLPDVPVVVVSAVENRQDTLRAIDLGAMGYIPKTASSDEFLRLLNLVLEGEIVLPRNVMDRRESASPIAGSRENSAYNEQLATLTKRQRQVLDLLAQGKPNVEIARELGVSEKTVRFYISAILKSLKVNNRTQAALIAAGVI
jgi:DNA-binding NarL/FixJ family response regulator